MISKSDPKAEINFRKNPKKNIVVKRGASSRWSFRQSSTWRRIETTTIDGPSGRRAQLYMTCTNLHLLDHRKEENLKGEASQQYPCIQA